MLTSSAGHTSLSPGRSCQTHQELKDSTSIICRTQIICNWNQQTHLAGSTPSQRGPCCQRKHSSPTESQANIPSPISAPASLNILFRMCPACLILLQYAAGGREKLAHLLICTMGALFMAQDHFGIKAHCWWPGASGPEPELKPAEMKFC